MPKVSGSKGGHQGKVTGPNSPSASGKLTGGNNNREQTAAVVRKSYKKARGDG